MEWNRGDKYFFKLDDGSCLTGEIKGTVLFGDIKNVIINDKFDFSGLEDKIDFAIAKSLFTHLTKDKIKQCLDNLKKVFREDSVFYTSIFIGDSKNNLKESHDNKKFQYSIDEIKELAEGWCVESLGKRGCWKQSMFKLTLS